MISFDHPAILLAAIPILPLFLLVFRRIGSEDSALRRATSWTLRFTALIALAVAVAGPTSAHEMRRPPATVFALDVSDSVPEAALDRAAAAIEAASRSISAQGGWSSLVLYGGRAVVARPPSHDPIAFTGEIAERVFARRTYLAEKETADPARRENLAKRRQDLDPLRSDASGAILQAQTLYLPLAENRTVLITDGEETNPEKPLPIDSRVQVYRLPRLATKDVVLRDVRAPLAVRTAEPFDIELDIYADTAGSVAAALTIDDIPGAEPETFRVAPGVSTIRIRNVQAAKALDPGMHRINAVLSSDGDPESRNNSGTTTLAVVGKSRMVLVEGSVEEGEGLARLLQAQGIDFERLPVDRLASRIDELDRWSSVALVGVAPTSITAPVAEALERYLDNGGGLFFAGSSKWTDPRLFDRTELTKLLPVDLVLPDAPKPPDVKSSPAPTATPDPPKPDPPKVRKPEPRVVLAPPIALLLVIDKSGSMAGDAIGICREAAIATAETLNEKDYIGLLAFDSKAQWVLEFTEARRTELIKTHVLRLFADGGTVIQPALDSALKGFKENPLAASAGVKHAIILSDGEVNSAGIEERIKAMSAAGIVVSTVCVVSPDGFKDSIMRKMAEWGKGRFFFAPDFKSVPKIFTDEAKYIIKETVKAAQAKADKERPPVDVEPPKDPPIDNPKPPTPSPAPSPTPPTPAAQSLAVVFKDDHEVLKGINREAPPPTLAGILRTKLRVTASQPLALSDGGPVLAVWRYGLGRCATWTSDVGGPWTSDWSKWDGTTKLFAQVIRHLSTALEDIDLASSVRIDRAGPRVDFFAGDGIELHLVSPKKSLIPLVREADGSRHAKFKLTTPGVPHVVSIQRRRGEQNENLTAEFILSCALEIAAPPDRPAAFVNYSTSPRPLDELAKGTPLATMPEPERTTLAGWFVLIALALLPLDVAVRRIR